MCIRDRGEADHGAGGNDLIEGGAGDDSLAGQGGSDRILGGDGDDTLLGGDGDDVLDGGAGRDWLAGHAGNDSLFAGAGEDDLSGGEGDDLLVGTDADETSWLHGGAGNDRLAVGAGDFAEGQEGEDVYILHPGHGPLPVIAGFDGEADEIELHLPDHLAPDAEIDLRADGDGGLLLWVNGMDVARLVDAVNTDAVQVLVNARAP